MKTLTACMAASALMLAPLASSAQQGIYPDAVNASQLAAHQQFVSSAYPTTASYQPPAPLPQRVPPVTQSSIGTPAGDFGQQPAMFGPVAQGLAYETSASDVRYNLTGSGDTCDSSCCEPNCGPERCCAVYCGHKCGIFADFLLLQPRNIDMPFAIPQDGIDPTVAVPVGAVGVADPHYEPGFRIGGNFALSPCTSIGAMFSYLDTQTNAGISTSQPNVIHSLVTHPNTASAAANSQLAEASYDINFRIADVYYKALWTGGPYHEVNWLVGARYAHLDQDFSSSQSINAGITTVTSDIDFDGAGPRVGLEGERRCRTNGFLVYGNVFASFLAGNFGADYLQADTFALTQATTAFSDDRVVTILEYELGVGWISCSGCVRVKAGYYMAAWYNTLTTGKWIDAVQGNNYVDQHDTVTFDGLVTRIEFLW